MPFYDPSRSLKTTGFFRTLKINMIRKYSILKGNFTRKISVPAGQSSPAGLPAFWRSNLLT
jgi:hypothetical protein